MKNGWPMMSVVPVKEVWVIANFKETQLNNIKVGQKVKIIVDAYPDYEIKGTVLSMSPASASSFSLIPLKMLLETLLKWYKEYLLKSPSIFHQISLEKLYLVSLHTLE